MPDPAIQPREIDLDRARELRIRWGDGRECVYPLAMLRRACPCAGCRADREREAAGGLPVARPAVEQREMATVQSAELVGQYAMRLTWKDGHSTGIYDFAFLRSLCTQAE